MSSGGRIALAALWTALCVPATFLIAGLSMMGDCGEPVERCDFYKRLTGLTVAGLGVIVLVTGVWFIHRKRER